MPRWVKEFREFINRGNVLDLAVAVVIGAAFTTVVKSFVDDVLMQVVAAIFGEPDFRSLTFDFGDATIGYGAFLTEAINFVLIAFAVFLVVKAYNRFRRPVEPAEDGPSEVDLLIEIRDALVRR